MIERDCDVLVIGAGAAGLLAAARCAELGQRVLLLEKGRRPGVKILMSGGTRCNLTHSCDRRGIVEAFGPSGRFLHSALAALSPADLVALVEAEGVRTKVESTGKVFPESNKAADVLSAFIRRLDRSGCVLETGQAVREFIVCRPHGTDCSRSSVAGDSKFQVSTEQQRITARHVIVTTGGLSYPGCGTTGDGYAWAKDAGHTIVPPRPSLVPIKTGAEWVRSLMGVTISDVRVKVLDDDRRLGERRGGFLFAHFGLTGPAVLDVSRDVTLHPEPQRLQLACDFLPEIERDALDERLRSGASRDGRRQVIALATDCLRELAPDTPLPQRLLEALVDVAGVPTCRHGAELTRDDRRRIVDGFKNIRIPISGTLGFEKAEVTAGGVSLDEVDSRTMQSRRVPGLFFAGEILDLDGPIGGYNFQAAFSTGWLAGTSCGR